METKKIQTPFVKRIVCQQCKRQVDVWVEIDDVFPGKEKVTELCSKCADTILLRGSK